ncbi:MAG TPA: hypothetical protein PKU97_23865, partial [Kofleriaceae bacterium]|nr:hypothetical protein [Kofleriaceae bacterium]
MALLAAGKRVRRSHMNRTRISRQVGIKSGVGLLASALLALASCGSPNETQERELPGSAEEGSKPSAQPG